MSEMMSAVSGEGLSKKRVTLLDYGAGNVRSIRNALKSLGCEIIDVKDGRDIEGAEVLVFPGVGAFGPAVRRLKTMGVWDALKEYLRDIERPFLGICIGMQVLFEGSEESPGTDGLAIFSGRVAKFQTKDPVPHIGWNLVSAGQDQGIDIIPTGRYYYVHSYCVPAQQGDEQDIQRMYTEYGGIRYLAAIQRGRQFAVQFHPEKSAQIGLQLLDNFFKNKTTRPSILSPTSQAHGLALRIVAALDVRENDNGDLVVTKGDSYDVREKEESSNGRQVRNLGKPVELADRYYREGCDELAFLNICAFKGDALADLPLLEVLRKASEKIFVPMTVGGGVRSYDTKDGTRVEAIQVAAAYFRAGADKISIGSDAVYAAQKYFADNCQTSGSSSIEQVSTAYGAQAVVVSVDPKRAWVSDDEPNTNGTFPHRFIITHPTARGPNDETRCWYRCTVSGGRKETDLDAVQLCIASQALGAGEIMLNCIDTDGKQSGFELPLLSLVKQNISIPVIASSGAGSPDHFVDVFTKTNPPVDAALAAGIFHRKQVAISQVKAALASAQLPVRS